jgi:hypothetical protein
VDVPSMSCLRSMAMPSTSIAIRKIRAKWST